MKRIALVVAIAYLSSFSSAQRTGTDPFDLVFVGGRVVDGTGAPWFEADVGVRGGKIAAVGKLRGAPSSRTVSADGLVLAPGFIDLLGQSEYNILVDPRGASKVMQGITTEVTGEGESIAPLNDQILKENEDVYRRYGVRPDWRTLGEYFASLERRGIGINLGTFVGTGTARSIIIGRDNRPAAPAELTRMETLVDQAMQDGALGVSSSLQYIPNIYATTEELIALSKVAARYGGSYFTHQRSESGRIDISIDEVIRIAREAKIRTQIWHLKTAYRPNFGRMPEILKKLEDARSAGVDVAANVYPWDRASNGLDACLPPWVREGGREALLKRLADPALRERVKSEMAKESSQWENQYLGAGGAGGVMVAEVLDFQLKRYEGRTIARIAEEEKKDPRDVVIDIVRADGANASCILSIMDDRDVRAALAHPLISFGTDSPAKAIDGPLSHETSHPRGWGSASRILGYYVREQKVLRLEEAVRKMTSLAAAAAGFQDRGILRAGLAADLVAFDPVTVRSEATFETPNRYSTGFRYVAVNGVLVVDDGKLTGKTPGQPLRGPGYRQQVGVIPTPKK